MTEKQYRLNKWGTRLLKNNRPLFDWANESDDIVELLNEQEELIKRLKTIREEQTETILKQKRKIKELEEENKRLKQGKYVYMIHGGSNDRK